MKCHQCQYPDTKVIESRDVSEGQSTRRRRECTQCKARFTTYERLERPQLVVIKRSGTRQIFDRNKLLSGLHRACEKTPVTGMQIESLVSNIENTLYGRGEAEIESTEVGELIMQGLAELSEVAYVRFASVYRRFSDVTGFENELEELRTKQKSSNK
ncbi:transcriptional repressor NrdR [Candidatus Saccharibacteria bacterium]|nr:transcriptional repressor NrdR [Candidatus Saccharibacteria bacterium]